MRKTAIFIAVLIFTLGVSVFDAVNSFNASYDGYLSGEYYFRWRAETIAPADFMAVSNVDMTNPENILYFTGGVVIRACDNDHDGLCEVIYDYKEYDNFPAGKLAFSSEDLPYLNGSKVYSKREYHEALMDLDGSAILDGALSDPVAMKAYKTPVNLLIILLAVDILGLSAMFVLKNFVSGEHDTAYNAAAYIIFFINLGWNGIIAFLLMF